VDFLVHDPTEPVDLARSPALGGSLALRTIISVPVIAY